MRAITKGQNATIYTYSESMTVLWNKSLPRANEVGKVCEVDEVYEASVNGWTREVDEVDEVREVYEV
jgi:hypothetical protein